jgi:hypothetical protein
MSRQWQSEDEYFNLDDNGREWQSSLAYVNEETAAANYNQLINAGLVNSGLVNGGLIGVSG